MQKKELGVRNLREKLSDVLGDIDVSGFVYMITKHKKRKWVLMSSGAYNKLVGVETRDDSGKPTNYIAMDMG